MLSLLASVLLALSFSGIECRRRKCEAKLEAVKIVPTYADFGTSGDLQVLFGRKHPVDCGNELPLLATVDPPVLTYDARGRCESMAVVFFDPDNPLLTNRIFLHWFVSNIPFRVMRNGYDGRVGNVLSSYFPPAVPTGNHRYTLCVYCQRGRIRGGHAMDSLVARTGIHPRTLARRWGLGNPEACNFFYSAALDVAGLERNAPFFRDLSDLNKRLGNRDEALLW